MNLEIAKLLWDARVNHEVLDREILNGIVSVEHAYAIQEEQSRLCGLPIVGWKLGATSPAAQVLLDVPGPFSGPVYEPAFHRDRGTCPIVMAHKPMLETEFAITLAKDLPSRDTPYTRDDIKDAVGWVSASFEVVASRFEGGLDGAGLGAIADGGADAAVILGGGIAPEFWDDPAALSISVEVNGKEIAACSAANLAFDHIFDGVQFLTERLKGTPHTLRAGDFVMSGTCSGVHPLAPGDTATARFGDAAVVSVEFCAA